MTGREKRRKKKGIDPNYPILAAQKFIQLFEQVPRPNEEQRAILAAAYYTLATQQNISCNRSKMHVNAAIVLLKNINIKNRKANWNSQIAHAYFKRAEILEERSSFQLASRDYQHAIQALERAHSGLAIEDDDRLLLAQSAISIADLIVNEQIEVNNKALELSHPLFYINKALEHLAQTTDMSDDIWATLAYAHQTAGLALGPQYFEEAKEAFRIALLMAFKTENVRICPLLADIYTCLGLLYEQRYQSCPIEKISNNMLDHAILYFGFSLLFTPDENDEDPEDDITVLESLFEMIYRILDPYLSPLSYRINCDLIDALIYAYMCVNDQVLPNQSLAYQLNQPDALDTYAQHIYWLIIEAYHKQNPGSGLLELSDPAEVDIIPNTQTILAILQNHSIDNVYYLKK